MLNFSRESLWKELQAAGTRESSLVSAGVGIEPSTRIVEAAWKTAVGEDHKRRALGFITGFCSAARASLRKPASSAGRLERAGFARGGMILKSGRPPLFTRISSPRAVRVLASWHVSRTNSVTVIVVIIGLS